MSPAELRAALAALGLNQTRAAAAFEVDTRTVRRWEREGLGPSPARVALRLMLAASGGAPGA